MERGKRKFLYVRPVSWVLEKKLWEYVEMFGYTNDGRTVYVRIPRKCTFVLKFRDEVDEEEKMKEALNAEYVKRSDVDDKIMIVRSNEISLSEAKVIRKLVKCCEVQKDPQGELEALWEAKEIGPYEWLEIEKFTPIPGKYTTADLNIITDESYIRSSDIRCGDIITKVLCLKIFSNEECKDGEVSTIKVTTCNNKGEYDEYMITREYQEITSKNVIAVRCKEEKDVLLKFLAVYSSFSPDRVIYYGEDNSGIIYLLKRMNICGVDYTKTFFSREIEKIDLKNYYRKTRLFSPVKNSQIDTLNLCESFTGTNSTQSYFEFFCNNLGISFDTFLNKSLTKTIDIACYNIDAGACLIKGRKDYAKHLEKPQPGIYQNIYIYDYSEIYRHLLVTSGQFIGSILGERLESSPPELIYEGFFSKYVDRTKLLPLLSDFLNKIHKTKSIIGIDSTTIFSVGVLSNNKLNFIDKIPWYVSPGDSSFLIIDNSGQIKKYGLSDFFRPKFALLCTIMKNYIFSTNKQEFQLPVLQTLPLMDFVMKEKLCNFVGLDPKNLKYILSSQYGSLIDTCVTVNYVMTIRGPVLVSKLQQDDVLDYTFYSNESSKFFKYLQTLKIHNA